MKVFIASCTRGTFIFNAKLPENPKIIRVEIPSGHQVVFPIDMNEPQRAELIQQLERYGARERKGSHGKLEKFHGLVYSDEKPMKSDEIIAANVDQLDSAQNRSVEQATRSALAAELPFRDPKDRRKRTVKTVGIEVLEKTEAGVKERPMMNVQIDETGSRNEKLPV